MVPNVYFVEIFFTAAEYKMQTLKCLRSFPVKIFENISKNDIKFLLYPEQTILI